MSSEWRRDPSTNPRGFGSLTDRLNRIEQQIRALAARAGINNATMTGLMKVLGSIWVNGGNIIVSAGGMIIDGLGRIDIMNGGSILVRDRQERDVFYAGGFAGEGFGIAAYRLDGSIALILVDDDDAQELVQRLKLIDRNSRLLLAEDKTGEGLAWPLIPLTTYCDDFRKWAGTAATSFTTIAGAQYVKHSKRAYVRVKHTSDTSGTTGEIRVTANGAVVAGPVPVGFAFGTLEAGPFNVSGNNGDLVDIRVECRRTAGTGEIRAELLLAASWPSA